MMPKMPRMFGANITSMLIKVSRIRAMAMWRNQLKDFVENNICWMALRTCRQKIQFRNSTTVVHWALQRLNKQRALTYREQHNGDSQCDSSKDSHSHTQDQSVIRINSVVGVQQFRLHLVCRNIKREVFY